MSSEAGWFRRSGLKRWQFIVRKGVDIGYRGDAGEGWGRTGIIWAGWYWDVGDVVELDVCDVFIGECGALWRWREVGAREGFVEAGEGFDEDGIAPGGAAGEEGEELGDDVTERDQDGKSGEGVRDSMECAGGTIQQGFQGEKELDGAVDAALEGVY